MDEIKTSEREGQQLNWADWMDELLKENFEKKALAWTNARPSRPRIMDLDQNQRAKTSQVSAPA